MKNQIINLYKIKSEIGDMSVELKTSPKGHLNKRGKYYYHFIGREGSGVSKNKVLIKLLCRKKYILARLEQLERNLSCAIVDFDHTLPKDLIISFSKTYQEIPISYFYHPSIEAWLKEEVESNSYPIKNGFRTSYNKILVRSKSEQIIGSLLEEYGIVYRYDTKLMLDSKTRCPDFIIKNPFTGKEIIWEHYGALHQNKYEESMHEKMHLYLKQGYIPNDTIIFTFEIDISIEQRLVDIIENIIL